MMYQPDHDVDLVEQAQAGNKQAFNQLVDRYGPMTERIAFRLIGNAETARDLAQEAILQAYLSLATLRQGGSFQSWLYGIVLNVCRNYRRSQKLNFLSLEALAGGLHFDALPFTSTEPEPHVLAEMRELHEQVLAAVATLSPKNREATLLFYYEGQSLQEIALTLGISVTAVKGRLHKARLQLREALVAYQPLARAADHLLERNLGMILVTIADVIVQEENGNRVVVLLDEAGRRVLPLWIGPFEAESITLHLLNQAVPRPLTYDLMAKLLEAIGVHLEEVRIERLHESTFYAIIKIRNGETLHEIDARPSDAMALALRMKGPIWVADEVMSQAGEPIPAHIQTLPQRKGLDAFAQQWEEKRKEWAQQMEAQKAAHASRTQSEHEEIRQKLFAYLFRA
ncbi:MAG: bifunctional nuclease family protein [Caldilineaceae bacterium]|nr:bifunctional nuclease family protein [Caldilineaceae bacterium]